MYTAYKFLKILKIYDEKKFFMDNIKMYKTFCLRFLISEVLGELIRTKAGCYDYTQKFIFLPPVGRQWDDKGYN